MGRPFATKHLPVSAQAAAMRRRSFTALLTLGAAGCLGASPGTDDSASTGQTDRTDRPKRTTTRDTAAGTDAGPVTDGPSDTSTPDPSEIPPPPGDSTFADAACPPVLDACYHQATAESRAYVRPSTERAPPQETIEFTLVNRGDASLFFGPYHWRIWRAEGGSWTDLSPAAKLDLGGMLSPGGTYSWTAEIDAEGGAVWPDDRNSEDATVAFTPGRYCFGIDVDAETETENEDVSVGVVGCLFEVTEA